MPTRRIHHYFCSAHQRLTEGVNPIDHLKTGHKPGSFIVDKAKLNHYFVVLPNGNVTQAGYSGVSKVLSFLQ